MRFRRRGVENLEAGMVMVEVLWQCWLELELSLAGRRGRGCRALTGVWVVRAAPLVSGVVESERVGRRRA